ncbi:HAMP domain-containing histidine kinase [Streptomyces sp. NBC_01478]|uniref:HAMP domain-containing sensor histidine kinase n=1 Tax=Streptomyces sp. NBC_01478 TaxID=2903882 RepID=UPI002E3768BE|nr:HAMP domain-containing sensor histidine kinase [Streptomyces sp. NBC_01478]
MNRRRPVLRLPWPATLRNRLTLLVAIGILVLLAAIAFAVAVQARASLLASTRQRIPSQSVFDESAPYGYVPGIGIAIWVSSQGAIYHSSFGIDLARAERLLPCTRSTLTAEVSAPHRDTFCLTTIKADPIRAWSQTKRNLVSEGSLSLLPLNNPAHGSDPLRRLLQVLPLGTTDPPPDLYVVYTHSLRPEQAHLNTIVWQLAAGTLGFTLVVAGSTWLVAGRVLRPVEAIRADFAELSAHHLDRRIAVPRAGREITRLADTMNTTLDRLQAAVEQQRQFTADASHELRTPLACLRTELELALNHPGTADWPRVVHAAHDDTLRLQGLTTDLLLLARLDAGHADPPLSPPLDLTDLVRDETSRRTPPPHLTLTVHTPPEPLPVDGHHALLARILGNLLDNAERHAASTVTVRLTCDAEGRQAVLEVLDDGPGIPPEHHQRIFERFSRLDDARTRDDGGAGLGLAIAERIATTHQGTLTLAPSPQGAHFLLHLPTSADRLETR